LKTGTGPRRKALDPGAAIFLWLVPAPTSKGKEMAFLTTILDGLGLVTAAAAAWFWYLSGNRRLRRVSRFEKLDYADLNRIVTAFNRASILNRQAAKAAAASAAALALRFAVDLVARI